MKIVILRSLYLSLSTLEKSKSGSYYTHLEGQKFVDDR